MIIRNLLFATAITVKLALVGLFSYWVATPTEKESKTMLAACPWCEGDPICEDSSCSNCG